MARKAVPAHPLPRLYLATPVLADAAATLQAIEQLLSRFDIAAVLVRLAAADERTLVSRLKSFAPVVQKAGAALLCEHYNLVARSGADGANVGGIAAMQEALPSLKPDRIIGVGQLHTRHDAMVAGEAGADYVLFGEPDANGERPSSEAIAERLQWWAEVFESPCVGYAASFDEAGNFTAAGADFIMAGDLIWNDARGPRAALEQMDAVIRDRHRRAFGALSVGQPA